MHHAISSGEWEQWDRNNNVSSLEIRNCEFRNLTGIAVDSLGHINVLDTIINGASTGISGGRLANISIENSDISQVGTGISSGLGFSMHNTHITGAMDIGVNKRWGSSNITNSTISGGGQGIRIRGADQPNHNIQDNLIENNARGIHIETDIWEPTFNIKNNSFADNTDYGIYNRAWGFPDNMSKVLSKYIKYILPRLSPPVSSPSQKWP